MPLKIITNSVNSAFIQIAERLSYNPDFISSPRTWETREILGTFAIIKNPYDRLVTNIHRKISLKYLVGEWLWYERGSNSLEEISYYSKFWRSVSDNQKIVNSAYGHRILGINKNVGINQWKWVKRQILSDPDTRRAVMFIALPSDIKKQTKDFPCTLALQFFIRSNKLYLTAIMRSNDLVLGFTYDAASFTLLQEKMLLELKEHFPNLEMGYYIHIATSMHIYKRHYDMIKNVADHPNDNVKIIMPKMANLSELSKLQFNEKVIRTNSKEKLKKLNDKFCLWCQEVLLGKIK